MSNDDWTDLVHYIIRQFTTMLRTRPHVCAAYLLASRQDNTLFEAADENGFTKAQLDCLHWYYSECQDAPDTVEAIIGIYKITGSVIKTRSSVIEALLSKSIITCSQYKSLIGSLRSDKSPWEYDCEESVVTENRSEYDGDRNTTEGTDEIEALKSKL